MSTQLYTVTLTDLGTYAVTVAADTPADAVDIAKTALTDEATTLPNGMSIAKREIEGVAIPYTDRPTRKYRVVATYSLDVYLTVPGQTASEAELHAKRLYESKPFPWEFETGPDQIRWFSAREVDQ